MNRTIEYVGGTADEPDYVYYNADIVNNTTDDQTSTGDAIQDPNIVFNETRDAPILKDITNYNFSIVRFTMNGANLDLPLFIPSIREGTGQTNPNLTTYSVSIPYSQWINTGTAPSATAWTYGSSGWSVGSYCSYVSSITGITNYAQALPTRSGAWGTISPDPNKANLSSYYWQQIGTSLPADSSVLITALPQQRFIQYVPQNKNTTQAIVPQSLANQKFVGQWGSGTQYNAGDVVSTTAFDTKYNTYNGPFYRAKVPTQIWSPNVSYQVGDYVSYLGIAYYTLVANKGVAPLPANFDWAQGPPLGANPNLNPYWSLIGTKEGVPQDLSTDYYWVYTYQQWLDQVNTAILDPNDLDVSASSSPRLTSTCAICDTYYAFYDAWVVAFGSGTGFPYATLRAFLNGTAQPPQITYDGPSQRFSVYCDSDGFGQRLTSFTPSGAQYGAATPPEFRLFFNTNLFNLFANLPFYYWNQSGPTTGPFPQYTSPTGYVYEILITNKFYQNVADYRLSPYSGTPPLGYVPSGTGNPAESLLSQLNEQKVYWVITQEIPSTDTLWSPIQSIVFSSALMPVKPEANAAPVVVGQSNIGYSTSTAQSAFTRIITDISLSMAQGAASYKSFIYYVPTAEYRMSDFLASHQPLQGVDVQVFWKNRLNNQLYPISMTNLSSVSFKMMFKKKGLGNKADQSY